MTVQQKLDHFAERALERAEEDRKKAAEEIQSAIKTALENAKKEAGKDALEQLKTERNKLEMEANRQIYKESMELRRKMSDLRERLADELIAELEKDISNFVGTAAYGDFLLEGTIAFMGAGFPILQLMERDASYKDPIEAETPFTVETTDEDFIGGFKLLSENRRTIADYTLLTRLGELYEDRSNFWDKRAGAEGS